MALLLALVASLVLASDAFSRGPFHAQVGGWSKLLAANSDGDLLKFMKRCGDIGK